MSLLLFWLMNLQDEFTFISSTTTLRKSHRSQKCEKISNFSLTADFDTALDVTPTSPSKEVHFVNDHESYDCEIHVAESHEEQINCYTKYSTFLFKRTSRFWFEAGCF